MRTQFCRTVTPDKLRACGASERVIKELEEVGFFCEEHPALSQSSTKAVKTVMKIPDSEVKEKVISHLEKRLEKGLDPVTGKLTKNKAVTETQVKQVIAKIAPEEKVPEVFKPPRPIERTDQDDQANGVVKRDWNNGDQIPDKIDVLLRSRTKAVMRQMVRYGKAYDHYEAIDLVIAEGVAKWEDVCEEACQQECAEA